MMITRYASYVALALCACFGSSFASAMERPLYYFASIVEVGEMHSAAMARLDLTLTCWRSGGDGSDASVASNLRTESNHLVMVSVAPAGVPDWDIVTAA